MKQLQSFDFDARDTDSPYDPIVKLLVEDGVFAVELSRGEDFDEDVKVGGLSNTLRGRIRKAGRRARIRIKSKDVIVVGLWPEGEGPKRPTRRRRRETTAA